MTLINYWIILHLSYVHLKQILNINKLNNLTDVLLSAFKSIRN